MTRVFYLCVLCASAVESAPLSRRIDAVLSSAPTAFWGIHVVDLATGRTVYQKNHQHFFVPASNTKLFSTALALTRLGPDHRFETAILSDGAPEESGRLRQDLRLVGGGDPSLSARLFPYRKGPATGDPLAAITALADHVLARGINRIDGDIVGDDTAFAWEPYPAGWAQNDTLWEYGAPVSALTINDNAFSLTVRPAERAGEPARLFLKPPLEYYAIDNRVRTQTGAASRVRVDRLAGTRQLQVWGAIRPGSSGETQVVAIDDPALYAAQALKEALESRGVVGAGRAVARHRPAGRQAAPSATGAIELARRVSPPLLQILQVIDKVSQNLHAELVLREVGRVRRGDGSREAALEELRDFLGEDGIQTGQTHFQDASGLSRLTLASPASVTALLAYMYRSPHKDAWLELLPVGGEDGTLSGRFDGNAAASRIRAKTGSLSHVSALSGYAGRLAFSILVNNYNAPAGEIRKAIDRVALALVE